MAVSRERIRQVAQKLNRKLYERPFRGKARGRFQIARDDLKQALDVERLHAGTVRQLQDYALSDGLVIIDLDETFICIEKDVVLKYRRATRTVVDELFPHEEADDDTADEGLEDAEDD
jgi:hypothetical protein